jgi:hypothetical protein
MEQVIPKHHPSIKHIQTTLAKAVDTISSSMKANCVKANVCPKLRPCQVQRFNLRKT